MLLILQKLAAGVREMPVFLWYGDYLKLRDEIVSMFEKKLVKLDDPENANKKRIEEMISALQVDPVDEARVGSCFSEFAMTFKKSSKTMEDPEIKGFVEAIDKLTAEIDMRESYRLKREKLVEGMSGDEILAYDKRFFEMDGMMYCLEYYLEIYKNLVDMKSDAKRKAYIRAESIDFGFGEDIPGLYFDMVNDEILQKFILGILSDELRNCLLVAYYKFKHVITGKTVSDFSEFLPAFKEYILVLLKEFKAIGIQNLGSTFLKPYGEKPLIDDVVERI